MSVPALHIGFGVAPAVTAVGTPLVTDTAVVVAVVVPHTLVAYSVLFPALPATTPVTVVLSAVGRSIAVPPGPLHE